MRAKLNSLGGALLCAALVCACEDSPDPTRSFEPLFNTSAPEQPAPSGLVTVNPPFGSATFWPYTGVNYLGIPQDPINLGFAGQVDPRALRAALMFLPGDRGPGLPDCVWKDAIGGVQTAYGEPTGWTGSAVQLECGDYAPYRFHVRFFDIGDWTIAGAHLDALVPGTTDHVVIDWDGAEQLVVGDFYRSGLLDVNLPLVPWALNNHQQQPPPPPIPPVSHDGMATLLNVTGSQTSSPTIARQEFVIQFDATIPTQLCPAPWDYLYVAGPVSLRQQVVVTPSGNFISQFHASGMLEVTPLYPDAKTYRAKVSEHHRGVVTDHVTLASQLQIQAELPKALYHGRLFIKLNVGPGGADSYSLELRCDLP